jgi:hypothetical protein
MAEDKKKFSLKDVETTFLQVLFQQHNSLLSNTLALFAIERLAYTVTEATRFAVSEDLKEITIWDEEPEAPAEETGVITDPKGAK